MLIISRKIWFNFLCFLKIKNKYDRRSNNNNNQGNNNLRESINSYSSYDLSQSERHSINSSQSQEKYNEIIFNNSNIHNYLYDDKSNTYYFYII